MNIFKVIAQIVKDIFTPAKANPDHPVNVEAPVPPAPPSEPSKHDNVLAIAKAEIGVKEKKIGSEKQVEKYHAASTIDNKNGSDDSIPWCSSFMCWVFEKAGMYSTNSKSARSWERWGTETKKPIAGDVVVFWRESKSSGKGHVALFMGYDANGNIRCLGGNQGDAVCIATYDKSRVLSFRTY